MKKIVLVVSLIFIFQTIGAVAFSIEKIEQKGVTLSFSQLSVKENSNYTNIELKGTNSVLLDLSPFLHFGVFWCI